MKKVDYNIEYSYISTDNPRITGLQKKSLKLAKDFIDQLKKEKKSHVSCVLIDDYSPSYSYLDVGEYLLELEKLGLAPDYVIYESRLVPLAEKTLSLIPKNKKITKEIPADLDVSKNTTLLKEEGMRIGLKEESNISYNKEYHHPLLIATEYLIRLGLLESKGLVIPTRLTKPKSFIAKKTMTILPKKWKIGEDSAREIIINTKFNSKINKIEHIYF
jgi:hypothetical protein